jgi:hypothetical protein
MRRQRHVAIGHKARPIDRARRIIGDSSAACVIEHRSACGQLPIPSVAIAARTLGRAPDTAEFHSRNHVRILSRRESGRLFFFPFSFFLLPTLLSFFPFMYTPPALPSLPVSPNAESLRAFPAREDR